MPHPKKNTARLGNRRGGLFRAQKPSHTATRREAEKNIHFMLFVAAISIYICPSDVKDG